MPGQLHAAAVPVVQPGHAVEQGGLAHAVFAHDGDKLAGRDVERDVGKHRRAAVVLAEVLDAQGHGAARWARVLSTSASTCASASGASAGTTPRCGMGGSPGVWCLA